MARGVLIPLAACVVVSLLVFTLSSAFVGTTSSVSSSNLRATQRVPDVDMNFYSQGAFPTTTPEPTIKVDKQYVQVFSMFFFACVAANAGGFFGPW